jgi:hypothetical protein
MDGGEGLDGDSPDRFATLRRTTADSATVEFFETLSSRSGAVVRRSYLYRWLTKEPEPEVVVIDLRETWTVGPVIAALDRVLTRVEPYWEQSAVKTALDRLAVAGERAADTRAGRLLATVLAPPEPPESERDNRQKDE